MPCCSPTCIYVYVSIIGVYRARFGYVRFALQSQLFSVYLRPDDPVKKFKRDSPSCAAAQVEEERFDCVEVGALDPEEGGVEKHHH